MEIIKEYIVNIAVYIILTGFINIILPNNSYRKYIGLVTGVIFVSLALEPVRRVLL